jgi:hypothetical protein
VTYLFNVILTPVNPFLFADRYLSVCFGGKKVRQISAYVVSMNHRLIGKSTTAFRHYGCSPVQ